MSYKLIRIKNYTDTSYGSRVPSSIIYYLKPNGKLKEKLCYGLQINTVAEAEEILAGMFTRRLSNLFGLTWWI